MPRSGEAGHAGPTRAAGAVGPPLLAVVGATATGKSALALELSEEMQRRGLAAEVVNADAMQQYRGMDIGTAKLPPAERLGVPHHLLDVLEVTDEASVADYQLAARSCIVDIRSRGAVPILVGGSGLYVSSVLWDFRFPGTDQALRARLEADLEAEGLPALVARLAGRDPEAARAIGPHNGRRILRALEVIELTGEPFGAGLPDESRPWVPSIVLGLESRRDVLVPRLDARVEQMWRDGLVEEVAALLPLGLERGVTASRAIGYAQATAQVRDRITRAEAIAQTQALTRRYARRQVGWFRRYRSATWFQPEEGDVLGRVLRSGVLATIDG